jgi:hypothetical protein
MPALRASQRTGGPPGRPVATRDGPLQTTTPALHGHQAAIDDPGRSPGSQDLTGRLPMVIPQWRIGLSALAYRCGGSIGFIEDHKS